MVPTGRSKVKHLSAGTTSWPGRQRKRKLRRAGSFNKGLTGGPDPTKPPGSTATGQGNLIPKVMVSAP